MAAAEFLKIFFSLSSLLRFLFLLLLHHLLLLL